MFDRNLKSFLMLGLLLALPTLAAPASKVQKIDVDVAASHLGWTGKKVTGSHNGTVALKRGQFELTGQELKGGTFTIDMTSLKVDDLEDPKSNAKLSGHLKSEDFFSVEKNPSAIVKVTNVKPLAKPEAGKATHEVTADLTIKGINSPVTFPALIEIKNKKVHAKATVTVDRTKYNIKYGSGKFFQDLGDKVISDEFTIELDVVSKDSGEVAAR